MLLKRPIICARTILHIIHLSLKELARHIWRDIILSRSNFNLSLTVGLMYMPTLCAYAQHVIEWCTSVVIKTVRFWQSPFTKREMIAWHNAESTSRKRNSWSWCFREKNKRTNQLQYEACKEQRLRNRNHSAQRALGTRTKIQKECK